MPSELDRAGAALVTDETTHCERCGWQGASNELVGDAHNCPSCGSTWEVTEGSPAARIDPRDYASRIDEDTRTLWLNESSYRRLVDHVLDCAVGVQATQLVDAGEHDPNLLGYHGAWTLRLEADR